LKISDISSKITFETPLHVGRPNLGKTEDFINRVRDIFNNRWFTNNGCYVQEFETKLKKYLGVKHCIPFCNATVALEVTSRALGFVGEAIVPSFTFIATPHSLSWQGITPVFCDVDPHTHNIDIDKIESLISPQTTGILAVHVWGRPCNIDLLIELCQRHGLKLLFDAAHAFGCSYNGKMIGNFGDAEVFSFHATKFFNTFEGGAVATNNDELAAKIRLMKNFGFDGPDTVTQPGINGKMTEISAAMGLTSLESMDTFISRNFQNYEQYGKLFNRFPGLKMIHYNENEQNNYQYIIVEVDPQSFGSPRDKLVQFLHSRNVLVRRYFYPGCHQMEPYRTNFPNARLLLRETEELCAKVISFPNGTAVNSADIEKIGLLILEFFNGERD
jgi:dTDP-4-amino-4,6-dideoxygalactose transaminase